MEASTPTTHHLGKIAKRDIVAVAMQHGEGPTAKTVFTMCRVVKVLGPKEFRVRILKDEHIEAHSLDVGLDVIRFNLGPDPSDLNTSMFGTDLRALYHSTTEPCKDIGLHWLFEPEESDIENTHKGFNNVRKFLKAHNLHTLLDLPIVLEITNKQSKYLGMFRWSKDLRKAPARITCNTTEAVSDKRSYNSVDYVFAHELGHAVQTLLLDKRYPKHAAKWIHLHQKTVEASTHSQEGLDAMVEALPKAQSLKDWKGCVSQDDQDAKATVNAVLRWFHSLYGLPAQSIDVLLQNGDTDMLEHLMPSLTDLRKRRPKPAVSEYATVNPRELFAEAFAFYAGGRKLPSEVLTLLEKSLQLAAKALPLVHAELREPETKE